LNVEY